METVNLVSAKTVPSDSEDIKVTQEDEYNSDVAYMRAPGTGGATFGPRYAFLLLVMFCVYTGRLLCVYPLWTMSHIPFISPVYRQGEHWLDSGSRTAGALFHIIFGILTLATGLHQIGRGYKAPEAAPQPSQPGSGRWKKLKITFHYWFENILDHARNNPQRHQWVGRAYLVFGLCCIICLQALLPTMGQGASASNNPALIAMAEVTSALWLLVVSAGVFCARTKRIEHHRQLMKLSYALMMVPLTQRYLQLFLVPISMIVVSIFSSTWPGTNDVVWTMPGYGRADQAVLTVTSWMGLLMNILLWSVFRD